MSDAAKTYLPSQISSPRSRRPFSVTILVVVVLIFTSLSVLRSVMAVRQWDFLAGLPLDVPVMYLVVTGVFWVVMGIPLVTGLFLGWAWSSRLAGWVAVTFSVYYWLDRLLIAQRNAIAARWPFALGLNVMLLAYTFWVLTRPKTKAFLQ